MSERRLHHNPTPKPEKPFSLGREIVVFMGPEGAGKSTIAKKIEAETGKPRVSTGDLLRKIAEDPEAEYYEPVKEMFKNNDYLDSQLLQGILSSELKKPYTQEGFLLDGGFRTLEEAQGFPSLLENTGRRLPLTAVYLYIPTPESIKRLVTGPNARKRDGETEDDVNKRLDHHYNNLYERMQVIEQQRDWKIHYIDAKGTVEQTTESVRQVLGRNK